MATPAVIVTRSCPENGARAKATDGTAMFASFSPRIGTVVTVTPSPNFTSSAPVQPDFWKSEMMMASRRGSVDRVSAPSASLSAEP